MKIILATDFSKENQMLVPYALDLLRPTGGTIVLFHAYMDHFEVTDAKTAAEEEMKKSVSFLNEAIQREGLNNIEISTRLTDGYPEQQLLHVTREIQPDLVLMGTRGRGRKGFLEGSMSKSLMSKSPVPLLTIHEEYHYKPNNEVLYVTNFDKGDSASIAKVFDILKPYKLHLHVVSFVIDGDPAKAAKQMKELEQTLCYLNLNGELSFKLVYNSNPRDSMKAFCEENNISLAAFIPHRRHFYHLFFKDKVTKNDFYNLHIPLLVLPRN
ncbi:MAG: universal stress protein [Bacteroidales bacterium]|nr:universal stress protein [Bacteroidales bacterium]